MGIGKADEDEFNRFGGCHIYCLAEGSHSPWHQYVRSCRQVSCSRMKVGMAYASLCQHALLHVGWQSWCNSKDYSCVGGGCRRTLLIHTLVMSAIHGGAESTFIKSPADHY